MMTGTVLVTYLYVLLLLGGNHIACFRTFAGANIMCYSRHHSEYRLALQFNKHHTY